MITEIPKPAIRTVEGGVVSAKYYPTDGDPDWPRYVVAMQERLWALGAESDRHAADASQWRERARNAARLLVAYGARIDGLPADEVVDAIRILVGDELAHGSAGNRPPSDLTAESEAESAKAERLTTGQPEALNAKIPATQGVKKFMPFPLPTEEEMAALPPILSAWGGFHLCRGCKSALTTWEEQQGVCCSCVEAGR